MYMIKYTYHFKYLKEINKIIIFKILTNYEINVAISPCQALFKSCQISHTVALIIMVYFKCGVNM